VGQGPEFGLEGEKVPQTLGKRRWFMSGCTCGCQHKGGKKEAPGADKKNYICFQCNTFKETPAEAPTPECCGKKMQEMD
jgi:hypothetical protein